MLYLQQCRNKLIFQHNVGVVYMVLTDSGTSHYDVSNDVMKSAILKISNDDISGTTEQLRRV